MMSVIGPVQSRCHEGSPVCKKKSKVGRICWKGRFWAWSERVKECWMTRMGMIIEMSWQMGEEVSRDITDEADGKNQEVDSRCISEWAICDFQWGDGWWARKGDNRWRAGTARGMNRDQIFKIARLTGCKNFVGKIQKSLYSMRSLTLRCVRWPWSVIW